MGRCSDLLRIAVVVEGCCLCLTFSLFPAQPGSNDPPLRFVSFCLPPKPLAGDWREKVKKARKEQDEAPPPANSGRPDLVKESIGLPPGWQAMWDKGSGEIYYGNLSTGVRCPPLLGSFCLPMAPLSQCPSR